MGKGKGKRKPPAPTPAATAVNVHADGTTVYADGTGFAPNDGFVSYRMWSEQLPGNDASPVWGPSYSGNTASDANGNVKFHGPQDMMVPDTPRRVSCTMDDGTNSATGHLDL